jgi:hypothetical protein
VEIKQRLNTLRPDSERVWGTMNPAQALAHCSVVMDMAIGDTVLPQVLIGRIFGPFAKAILSNDKPFRRSMPTDKSFIVADQRDFAKERERLAGLIDRFAAGSTQGCTKHPHPFFGKLTPAEWAVGMYKHLDHHLQQFGV